MQFKKQQIIVNLQRSSLSIELQKTKSDSQGSVCVAAKTYDADLFDEVSGELESAIKFICAEIVKIPGYKGIPVRVILPDPAVFYYVNAFETLPVNKTDDFVEWKICNSFHLDKKAYVFHNTLLDKKTSLVMSLGVKKYIVAKIQSIFAENSIPLSFIDGNAEYALQQLANQYSPGSGCQIYLEHDYWTIFQWDELQNIRTIKTKWIVPQENMSTTWSKIVTELERIIRISAIENNIVSKNLYVAGKHVSEFSEWAAEHKSLNLHLVDWNSHCDDRILQTTMSQ